MVFKGRLIFGDRLSLGLPFIMRQYPADLLFTPSYWKLTLLHDFFFFFHLP